MAGMTIRDRVRHWLGLEAHYRYLCEFERNMQETVGDLRNVCNRMETGKSATDRHSDLIERLTKLEQHFVSQHVGAKPASIPVYDWDQVQLQELAEMLANPPKDTY